MLVQFAEDIWIADGSAVVAAAGFHYPTRMVVIRLANGDLFVWSPVKLTEDLRRDVDALGSVRHLIAPNSLHHVYIGEWKVTYPDSLMYAAPGLRKKRPDLDFDFDLVDRAPPAWVGQIDQVMMAGNVITTEIVFFHWQSGTALFVDLLQNLPKGWFSGWRAVIARLDLMMEVLPAVPRKFRVTFTQRRVAKEAIDRILVWPVQRVLMAHGKPVEVDGRAFLKMAFKWLTG